MFSLKKWLLFLTMIDHKENYAQSFIYTFFMFEPCYRAFLV